jgi:glyoxylase-like metal-dependent hydrolase (beta-lactamase superfamily II)
MTKVHHFNCLDIETAEGAKAVGHCLLLEDEAGMALVDTGIGLGEVQNPKERLGEGLIEAVGFKLDKDRPMIVQLQANGWNPKDVQDCIVSHLDIDHIGGLLDFPGIRVHVSSEEWENFSGGNPRYLARQMRGVSPVSTYADSKEKWFGLEARRVDVNFSSAIYLIPLFGHTLGHCGVAIEQDDHWILYAGDAYYYRVELQRDDHLISVLAALRADDNVERIISLEKIKNLLRDHPDLELFSAHDPMEFHQ